MNFGKNFGKTLASPVGRAILYFLNYVFAATFAKEVVPEASVFRGIIFLVILAPGFWWLLLWPMIRDFILSRREKEVEKALVELHQQIMTELQKMLPVIEVGRRPSFLTCPCREGRPHGIFIGPCGKAYTRPVFDTRSAIRFVRLFARANPELASFQDEILDDIANSGLPERVLRPSRLSES